MTSSSHRAASPPTPTPSALVLEPHRALTSHHTELNVKLAALVLPWGKVRGGGVLFLRRRWRKATGGIESLTPVTSTRLLPCSLATHKDFSCHSLACNHEWARGPRNPITSMASDACRHVLESNPPLVIFAFFASLPVSQLSLGLEHATLARR